MHYSSAKSAQPWIALVIGNSRLHWASFVNDELQKTWDEPYRQEAGGTRHKAEEEHERIVVWGLETFQNLDVPLWVASVVPEQTRQWVNYPHARLVELDDVPLKGMYPTLGIDRALALWGAIATLGSPVLVIDCGTALTFTGSNPDNGLLGGAILPGLRLQFEVLGQKTALLPSLDSSTDLLPASRWALDTKGAIASGILHTAIAGIHAFVQDWWQLFPGSQVVMTGGDSDRLHRYLQQNSPQSAQFIVVDNQLIFKGMQAIRSIRLKDS